jgi:hypothetical protein
MALVVSLDGNWIGFVMKVVVSRVMDDRFGGKETGRGMMAVVSLDGAGFVVVCLASPLTMQELLLPLVSPSTTLLLL